LRETGVLLVPLVRKHPLQCAAVYYQYLLMYTLLQGHGRAALLHLPVVKLSYVAVLLLLLQ
jgi:hypothetical protein